MQKGDVKKMKIAQKILRKNLIENVAKLEKVPTLIMIQVMNDKTYSAYYKDLKKDCDNIGIDLVYFNFENFTQNEICNMVKAFSNDEIVNGIIIQTNALYSYVYLNCISPGKDVGVLKDDSVFGKIKYFDEEMQRLALLENVVEAYRRQNNE